MIGIGSLCLLHFYLHYCNMEHLEWVHYVCVQIRGNAEFYEGAPSVGDVLSHICTLCPHEQ